MYQLTAAAHALWIKQNTPKKIRDQCPTANKIISAMTYRCFSHIALLGKDSLSRVVASDEDLLHTFVTQSLEWIVRRKRSQKSLKNDLITRAKKMRRFGPVERRRRFRNQDYYTWRNSQRWHNHAIIEIDNGRFNIQRYDTMWWKAGISLVRKRRVNMLTLR